MHASIRFSSLALLAWLAVWAAPTMAHKSSDAYLSLREEAGAATLRVDVALRDLDAALDLDADGDGALRWGEVRQAWAAIEAYLAARVQIAGCDFAPAAGPALERRSDGVYAAVQWSAPCRLGANPAVRYRVLADVDATHRGLLRIEGAGATATVRLLDPNAQVGAVADGTAEEPPASFLREGIHHIVTGYDHVLFLLCLLLPAVMRRTADGWRPVARLSHALWPAAGIATAFTAAHSITLALAAMKWVSVPSSVIEPVIALTIVLAAVDNLRPIFGGRRMLVTFAFGLIHGFGFAGVLGELDLPAAQFAWALLQFDLGIELGQMVIVATAIGGLFLVRESRRYAAWAIGGGSAASLGIGMLWLVERTAGVAPWAG